MVVPVQEELPERASDIPVHRADTVGVVPQMNRPPWVAGMMYKVPAAADMAVENSYCGLHRTDQSV